jgi:hypothetical protein
LEIRTEKVKNLSTDFESLLKEAHRFHSLHSSEVFSTPQEFLKELRQNPVRAEQQGIDFQERILSLSERYHHWFSLNYETGFEYHFDPAKLPDFEDPYWEPTPTSKLSLYFRGKTAVLFL